MLTCDRSQPAFDGCSHDEFRWTDRKRFLAAMLLALVALVPAARAIDIQIVYNDYDENPSYDPDGAWLTFMFNSAAAYWENYLPDSGTYEVDIFWSTSEFEDDPALARWNFDSLGNNNIYVNPFPPNGSSTAQWYLDPSPFDHSEYDFNTQMRTPDGNLGWNYRGGQWLYRDLDSGEQMDWFNGNVPSLLEAGFRGQATGGAPSTRYDLLSTVIHELGHELGVNSSGGPWTADPAWVNGNNVVFVEDAEGGHLAARSSLMCDGCGMIGTRRLPSAIDIMSAADDEGFAHVDLPRKDFAKGAGSFDWNSHANWLGDRVPDSDDWVFLRSGSSVSMSANSSAAQLLIDLGNSLTTGAHSLSVGGDTAIRGGIFSNGQLTVSSGGAFSTSNLTLNGRLNMNGGTADVDLAVQMTALSEIRGHGTVKAATLVNEGTIRAEGGTLVLEDLVSANLGGFSGNGVLDATAGNLEITALLTTDFDGIARVGAGHNIHQNIVWTLGQDGELNLQGGANAATLAGEKVTVRGSVATTGLGSISAPADFASSADVNVAAGGTLRLTNETTFRGGNYAGAGKLVQSGNATIAEDTQIDVATYDWDGHVDAAPSTTTIASAKTLKINSFAVENSGDGYDGTVNVNGGTLEVNTHGLFGTIPWRMEGTMNLSGPVVFGSARVQGSPLIIGDPGILGFGVANLNVQGLAVIDAPVTFESNARVAVASLSSLRLDQMTTFQGGRHTGAGTVYQVGNAVVEADTTIEYERYYMDGAIQGADSVVTINPGVSLIVDSKRISTGDANRFDGTLHINGGTLDMQTHDMLLGFPPVRVAKPWRMAGTMHLDATNGVAATVAGSPLIIGEPNPAAPAARMTVGVGSAAIHAVHVAMEPNAVAEFALEGSAVGQFGQVDVLGQMLLDGMLDLPVNDQGGSYWDPAVAGDLDAFLLISADAISGTFDDVMYDGALLAATFDSNGLFRSYQGNGLFRNVAYAPTDVTFFNYRALPGDANGDFVVDGSDYNIWNAHKFTSGTDWTMGDFNGDGVTDGSDFSIWNANKFTAALSSVVPEPSGLILILLGCCALIIRRK